MSEVRFPKLGETWKFPNGETLEPQGNYWVDSEGDPIMLRLMEWLAQYGAIVPVEPEVYEGECKCDEDCDWWINAGFGNFMQSPEMILTKPGDIVKWRVEVVRK